MEKLNVKIEVLEHFYTQEEALCNPDLGTMNNYTVYYIVKNYRPWKEFPHYRYSRIEK